MSDTQSAPLFAVDVGNSAVHVGLFGGKEQAPLPTPHSTFVYNAQTEAPDALHHWLADHAAENGDWHIASVHGRAKERLELWLARRQPAPTMHSITHEHLPLVVDVEFPERVGIDRLLAAVAVNRLRDPLRPAIVVDAGTAITVDCVSAAGVFLGGAILPGMRMGAQALDRYTEKLPLIDVSAVDQPPPVGRNTTAAIESGIFWGARGAVSQLVAQMAGRLDGEPQVFITGGDARRLKPDDAQVVPHLVLSGIAHVASLRSGA